MGLPKEQGTGTQVWGEVIIQTVSSVPAGNVFPAQPCSGCQGLVSSQETTWKQWSVAPVRIHQLSEGILPVPCLGPIYVEGRGLLHSPM